MVSQPAGVNVTAISDHLAFERYGQEDQFDHDLQGSCYIKEVFIWFPSLEKWEVAGKEPSSCWGGIAQLGNDEMIIGPLFKDL